ncbi:hypothetical protein [Paenibacillus swuensis]|nr:hypothetical protein [Paenibacillus swuensis]
MKVIPGKSIGPYLLGMTHQELFAVDRNYMMYGRIDFDSEGRANFIQIASGLHVEYDGLDVFCTLADRIVEHVSKVAKYNDYTESGCLYKFREIGLTFWRPYPTSEAYTLTDEFKALPLDEQEYRLEDLYFEVVGVFTPGTDL